MAETIEKIRLDNKSASQLLNPDFVKQLSELKQDIIPASIVLIKTKDNISIPLVISHQSKKEIEEKIIHIESPDQEFLDKVKNIIEKM